MSVPLLPPIAPPARSGKSHKIFIVLALLSIQTINYILRTALSVALDGHHGIGAELGWDDADKGTLLSAFFYGYVLQFIPGTLASRVGARPVLTIATALQTVLALTFPWCVRSRSLALASMSRALLGLVQGAYYSSSAQVIGQWFADDEISRAYSATDCGNSIGATLAMLGAPLLMEAAGWASIFWASGVASGVVTLIVAIVVRNPPPDADAAATRAAEAEAMPVESVGPDALHRVWDSGASSVPWGSGGSGSSSVQALSEVALPPPPSKGPPPPSVLTVLSTGRVLLLGPVWFLETWSWYIFLTFLPLYCQYAF